MADDNLITKEQTAGLLDSVATDATMTGDGTPGNPLSVVAGPGVGTVTTVNGVAPVAGNVSLVTDDIPQGVTNLYNQTHTGDVTGSIALTISALAVTNGMLAGSIAASKLVGSDIATVGTITSGVWNGTTIAVANGGTGATSFSANALLQGNGTSAITRLNFGSANQIVGMNNAGNGNEYKTLSLGTTAQSNDLGWVLSGANAAVLHIPNASASDRGVITTGAQTIAGVKTFGSIPIGPSADPTSANEFTRKAYVDALVVGLIVHQPCRVATTANLTLTTGVENGDVIDGITLVTGDRVLIKDQSVERQNGVYTVNASGSPTRATDYDTAGEILQGTSFYVSSGTVNATRSFVQSSPNMVTVDTDAITFAQVGSATNFRFFVGSGATGNDFNVVENGLDITYHLPTASATVRGALSSANWSTFNAKVGLSGSSTANQIPKFNDTIGTLVDSGITFTTGGATALTLPTSGTVATLAGTEVLTNKKLGSLTTNGFIRTMSGDGTLFIATNIALASDVSGVLPVANGGFNAVDVQFFTADGTWTKPTTGTPKSVHVFLVAGGGGGGSGRKGANGTTRTAGGGGGGGGIGEKVFPASILGATESVIVGVGGVGGASQTANTSNGNPGTAGEASMFGTWFSVGGGGGGLAGTTGSGARAAGGLGWPNITGYTEGSLGGQKSATGGAGTTGVDSFGAPTGGGAGGGLTTGNIESSGAAGGINGGGAAGYGGNLAGGTAGTSGGAGGNGNSVPTNTPWGGTGGGGGASNAFTSNAGAGGDGGLYGAGGGGGGASTNAVGNSGEGGDGADGFVMVITYF